MRENIFINAEGYADPTAYKAIIAIIKEEKRMAQVKAGAIWEFDTDYGEVICLVLAKSGGICTNVKLYDEFREDSDVQVNALGGMKYGCTARINYLPESRANRLIRDLKSAEMKKVKEALAARFEIEAPAPEPEEKTVEVEKIVEVTVPDAEIAAKLQELRETIIDLEDADGKLSQARTARFISRYMDVLGI